LSSRILLLMVLSVFSFFSASQNAYATITSVTLDPPCGPPGTKVILTVRFTQGSKVSIEYSPDVIAGGDWGETGFTEYFTVPEGVNLITIRIMEDGVPVRLLTFTQCSTVGGVVMPTSKLEIVAPLAVLAGVIAAVSAVVVVKRRRD